jgi:uncharacterized protein YecE (DUF72 family)
MLEREDSLPQEINTAL